MITSPVNKSTYIKMGVNLWKNNNIQSCTSSSRQVLKTICNTVEPRLSGSVETRPNPDKKTNKIAQQTLNITAQQEWCHDTDLGVRGNTGMRLARVCLQCRCKYTLIVNRFTDGRLDLRVGAGGVLW